MSAYASGIKIASTEDFNPDLGAIPTELSVAFDDAPLPTIKDDAREAVRLRPLPPISINTKISEITGGDPVLKLEDLTALPDIPTMMPSVDDLDLIQFDESLIPQELELNPSEGIEVEMPNMYPVMSDDFLNQGLPSLENVEEQAKAECCEACGAGGLVEPQVDCCEICGATECDCGELMAESEVLRETIAGLGDI